MTSMFYFLGTPSNLAEEGPQNANIALRHITVRNTGGSHYSSSHHSHPHLRNHPPGDPPVPKKPFIVRVGAPPNVWFVYHAAK